MAFLPEASDFIATSSPESITMTLRHHNANTKLEDTEFVSGVLAEAKKSKIWVSVGVHERVDANVEGQIYNSHLVVSDLGECVANYRKLHMFDVDIANGPILMESKSTKPGSKLLAPIETPVGSIGLLTCYDLRFPEVSIALRRQNAQVILYPSAFTVRTGAAHWNVLLRARAIETQSYVIAAAQYGQHNEKRVSYGHACIISPWGNVLAECEDVEPLQGPESEIPTNVAASLPSICMADINLPILHRVRRDMPLWEQRRTDVYPMI